jgi:hypothetical protein|tara:strand:- start:266 stop:538 length:273 start_codon:yes stop_codon:yes gene_type:complete
MLNNKERRNNMIKSKNKEKDYHYALVEAIRTIDDVQYGKFHPKWARLRRIVDLVLNHDRTIEYAIEKAELEVKITQDVYAQRKEKEEKRV